MKMPGKILTLILGALLFSANAFAFGDSYPILQAPAANSTEYPEALWVAANSSNYSTGRSGETIQYVIIHVMQGSYAGSISWFQNPAAKSSAHYMLRSSDGEITQMVSEANTAWHAGNLLYNKRSIGLEHEGWVTDASWFTDAMYESSARLVAHLCDKYGIPKDRDHIIGHHEVPDPYNPGQYGGAGHHTDPGSLWDWNRYIALIRGVEPELIGELIGYVREGDIMNADGGIANATVELSTGLTTKTDATGLYRFQELEPGTYTISVSAEGYVSQTDTKEVVAGAQNWKSFGLQKAGCESDCGDKECGFDDCGNSCGTCDDGQACHNGQCACMPNDHLACCDNAVCWFDSCKNQGVVRQRCPYGCADAECLDKPTQPEPDVFEAEVADDQDDLSEPEPDLGQEPDSEPEPEQTEDNGYSYDVPPLPQPYDEECEPCNGGCSAGSSNAFGALNILFMIAVIAIGRRRFQ